MNEFERKLSQQPFRAPPAELRDEIFGRDEVLANAVEDARWSWRDWLWPSPQAWGALAALWLVFAVLMGGRETSHAPASAYALPLSLNPTLLSYHTTRDLNHVLDLAN